MDAMKRIKRSLRASAAVLVALSCTACKVSTTAPDASCPAGLQPHPSFEDGASSRICVRKDEDGNIFPEKLDGDFRRYLFSTPAGHAAMVEHLEAIGFDVTAAQPPSQASKPWSVLCVQGKCRFDPDFGIRQPGNANE